MDVTLEFSTQRGLISAGIRWFTWSFYSHVDFVLPDGRLLGARWGKDGAARSGVQIRPANYENFSVVMRAVDSSFSMDQYNRYHNFLYSSINAKYDLRVIFADLIGEGDNGLTIWKPTDKKPKYDCSMLQWAASYVAGNPFLHAQNLYEYHRVTPGMLSLCPRFKCTWIKAPKLI